MTLAVLNEAAKNFGISVADRPFEDYLNCILTENDAYGLTSLRQPEEVESQLLADALAFFSVPDRPAGPVADLGSGAGIPGIPLALVDPTLEVTLVEARQRKGQFLARMIERLRLRHRVRVVAARAEAVGRDSATREHFAIVVAKGLAPLNVLLELAIPLLQVGGLLVAWKGPGLDEEMTNAKRAFDLLHAHVEATLPYGLPQDPAQRRLVLIRKDQATPETYPRRSGMPKKSPL
ncbi:MAG TPA: 16S rRNA (guanine(527)-N(7))-methyltransferase RsmG [Candidatus Xenobia bacterium]|jgi:16S rRNA (guanine527-N7)-methyltransferase